MWFTDSLTTYRRAKTIPVQVGGTVIGGDAPIRVQSMANTDTNNTAACVEQAARIAACGGELVRFTAQGRREAENLRTIKESLRGRGCRVPLVADIHFNPEAAFIAAGIVEKVRINPGNFIPAGTSEPAQAFGAIREKLDELVALCRENGTALRIGVNHGSLSERIMDRYGDTPAGMVASALEYLRICRELHFDRVVISMKSSNVRVMVHAYRMLAARMREEGMAFPLHLGVTEAGDAEDGRIKSAVGIGTLLADGLGDTIRVSLTEDPENEIPVARKLADYFVDRHGHEPIEPVDERGYSPFEYQKRTSTPCGSVGGNNPPVVVVSGHPMGPVEPAPDFIVPGELPREWRAMSLQDLNEEIIERLRREPETVIVLDTDNRNGAAEQRAFFLKLQDHGLTHPVIIRRAYSESDLETLQIKAAADLGLLLVDGYGDGVWIVNNHPAIPPERIVYLAFSILQASRVRITRTEFIACPGCGRTLFDLQTTLAKVKERTGHLKGMKIGVMGCIVNGPGEMADADYGYVGAGPGKVTLYKGKEVVKRNIPQEEALDELVELIRLLGDWQAP